MSPITTHVLDTAHGHPAAGVRVTLAHISASGEIRAVGGGTTDSDGRLREMWPKGVDFETGTYRLRFETGAYFAAIGVTAFHPAVEVVFTVRDLAQHYHVPVLLSPFGYSTYRGS
jgi:5-hydroxyisourate hydrolase